MTITDTTTSVAPDDGISKAVDAKIDALLAIDPQQNPLVVVAMLFMGYHDLNVFKAESFLPYEFYVKERQRLYALNHAPIPKRPYEEEIKKRKPTPRPRHEPVPYGHPDCRVLMPGSNTWRLWKTLTASEHMLAVERLRENNKENDRRILMHLAEIRRLEAQAN